LERGISTVRTRWVKREATLLGAPTRVEGGPGQTGRVAGEGESPADRTDGSDRRGSLHLHSPSQPERGFSLSLRWPGQPFPSTKHHGVMLIR